MKHIARCGALAALTLSAAASAGSLDVQPSLYLHYDFAGASAPALHWGAELNWGDRTLDALAQRLDPDSGRSLELQAVARRGLRSLLPALAHLELSDVHDLDLRVEGQSLLGWRAPYLSQNDGGAGDPPVDSAGSPREDSGWHWGTPMTIAAIVAGVGATAAMAAGGGGGNDDSKNDPGANNTQPSSEDCNIVSSSNGHPEIISQGCQDQIPGHG